jgi:hypothetical protein
MANNFSEHLEGNSKRKCYAEHVCILYSFRPPIVFPSLLGESAAEIGGAQNGLSFPFKKPSGTRGKKGRRLLDLSVQGTCPDE